MHKARVCGGADPRVAATAGAGWQPIVRDGACRPSSGRGLGTRPGCGVARPLVFGGKGRVR